MEKEVAVHSVIPRSVVNGPGERFCIWFQGCSINCPGCHNPYTLQFLTDENNFFLPPNKAGWASIDFITGLIVKTHANKNLDGVSISGGEPFDQPEALRKLLHTIKQLGLSTLVFTGYTLDKLKMKPDAASILNDGNLFDILIDGPYIRDLKIKNEIRGSSNQAIHLFSDLYKPEDITQPGSVEIIFNTDGSISITGFHIQNLR